MLEDVSVTAKSRPQRARRRARFIWVLAVCAGVTIIFGADVPTSVTATPEDPCLYNQTCGEENHIAIEEMQGDQLAAECDILRVNNDPIPPVCIGI